MPPGATFPPLEDDHVLAWRIYQEVQGQVIVGMDIVGLDFKVLPTAFDLYRVPEAERLALFRKVAVIDEAHREHRAVLRASESSRQSEAKTQAAAVARG